MYKLKCVYKCLYKECNVVNFDYNKIILNIIMQIIRFFHTHTIF